jgi:hypothetical protein
VVEGDKSTRVFAWPVLLLVCFVNNVDPPLKGWLASSLEPRSQDICGMGKMTTCLGFDGKWHLGREIQVLLLGLRGYMVHIHGYAHTYGHFILHYFPGLVQGTSNMKVFVRRLDITKLN